jgi:hypothetical protein
MIAHLFLAAVLASNAGGKTLVRQSQGTLVPITGFQGPLIADDANTVCHAYFDGVAIRDTKGCAWTMNGTVPQVSRNGKTPGGGGVFSDSNFYALGTGSDGLDFAGDFSVCIVATGAATATRVMTQNTNGSSQGYSLQTEAGRKCRITTWPAGLSADTGNATAAGEVFACCVGRGDGKIRSKLNLGALVEVTSNVQTPAAANAAQIGKWPTAGFPWDGLIYEVWFSSTPATDANFTAIQQRVKLRAQITAW